MKNPRFIACCCLLTVNLAGQVNPVVLPEENPETPETHQLVWETEPGVRYEAQSSGDMSSWSIVEGYPAAATSSVDAVSFGADATPVFLRVVQYDEQAPEILERSPDDAAFAVKRFSTVVVSLSDLTGVDPSSISLSAGTAGTFTVSDPQLSYENGVLTLDLGGDTALGSYDEVIEVDLAVADTLGNATSYEWTFKLEKETVVADNVFVLGSPEAQRTGQRLTPGQRAVYRRVGPVSAPVPMSAGTAPWSLLEVGEDHLLFGFTGDTPPNFQTGQFLANLVPERKNEIFYRKVLSITVDTSAKEVTVLTDDVSILELVSQASLLYNPATSALGVYLIADDGLLVDTQTSLLLGESFTTEVDFAEGAVNFELAGTWEFEPTVKLAVDIQGAQVEDFFCRFDGRSTVRMAPSITVTGAVEATASTAPLLSARHVLYLGQAGPVPVWVDMDFSLFAEAGVTVDASATLSTSIARTEELYVEAVYSSRNPDLSGIDFSPPTARLDVEPVTFVLEGHGQAYARLIPQVDVRLESVFGVYANVVPEIGLTGDATLVNGEMESASVELYGRVDLNAGLSLIGFDPGDLPSTEPVELCYYPWRYEFPEAVELRIETHPQSTQVFEGRGVVLRCVAVDDHPVSYQWFKDGIPLPGRTEAQLSIAFARLPDAGDYFVRLRSGSGSVREEAISETATLTVVDDNGPAPSDMVLVQGGTLPASSGLGAVAVSTFYIGRTEVTWGDWQMVRTWAATNGYDIASRGAGCADDHPVHSVAWYDVVKWCNAKSEMDNLTPVYSYNGSTYKESQPDHTLISKNLSANGYRLPTEAEWEFAARGGNQTHGYIYSGSDNLNTVGWYLDNSGGASCEQSESRGTWPVGQKGANELGLYDMSGNVWEWCWDVVFSASSRRIRGGSWSNAAAGCAVSLRNFDRPDIRNGISGFRLARSSGQ